MTNGNNLSNNLLKFILKAIDKKIYGSIEIYFEAGKITQVTQRIINKIHHNKPIKRRNGAEEIGISKMPT